MVMADMEVMEATAVMADTEVTELVAMEEPDIPDMVALDIIRVKETKEDMEVRF